MTVPPPNDTLLALLLAIKKLEVDLNEIEANGLLTAIDLLQLEPHNWEPIHNSLIEIIDHNPSLKEQFHNFLTRLEALEDSQKVDFIPTEEEMAQAFPQNQGIEIRGYIEGQADVNSRELLNESRKQRTIARETLKQENPREFSQQNAWLERIERLLAPLFNE